MVALRERERERERKKESRERKRKRDIEKQFWEENEWWARE